MKGFPQNVNSAYIIYNNNWYEHINTPPPTNKILVCLAPVHVVLICYVYSKYLFIVNISFMSLLLSGFNME